MDVLFGFLVILFGGILPTLVYALGLWWFDRYEKEPLGLVVAAFGWGAIPAVIFSIVTQLAIGIPVSYFVSPAATDLLGAVLVAPFTEEIFKGVAVLLLLLLFRREIDSPLDGILYGGLVGFGFAVVENVIYFFDAWGLGLENLVLTVILRAFLFGLNHALFTGLTGLGLALARTASRTWVRVVAPVTGLALGMAAHAVHNLSVTAGAELVWPCLFAFVADWSGVLLVVVILVWTILQERLWLVTYLADEVELGTLSQVEYRAICSSLERVANRVQALVSGDLDRWRLLGRYYHLSTKLAFNKRRLVCFPAEKDTRRDVARLRRMVAGLGARLR